MQESTIWKNMKQYELSQICKYLSTQSCLEYIAISKKPLDQSLDQQYANKGKLQTEASDLSNNGRDS